MASNGICMRLASPRSMRGNVTVLTKEELWQLIRRSRMTRADLQKRLILLGTGEETSEMLKRIGFRDILGMLADDDAEFHFPVRLGRATR